MGVIYKTTKKDVQEIVDIFCDKCGRDCIGECGNFCGISFTISGGYDSLVFPDDEILLNYNVCEYCVDAWMKTWCNDYLKIGNNTITI